MLEVTTTPTISSFQLTTDDQIAALEKELFALQKACPVFDGVQPISATLPDAPSPASDSTASHIVPHPMIRCSRLLTYLFRQKLRHPTHLCMTSTLLSIPSEMLAMSLTSHHKIAMSALVQNARVADDVFSQSMKSSCVTLTPEELLSISPEPVNYGTTELTCNGQPLRPGAIVLKDPYETYLRSLGPGDAPTILTVAKESHALRFILGLVDNKEQIESILDPGLQIIAMSEEVCHALSLIYDPRIHLNMQSQMVKSTNLLA
ncbi:hypothetical protein A0H81_03900 [Grifola frondosa]|uniref:Uncharacterized protein n=1 Tax=Grifola frondosa TaxID=5627 RepID=A0A1C7MGV4_GRIFR|nr:hypothetical protein A0H81_03900 [Grifola frondosa]